MYPSFLTLQGPKMPLSEFRKKKLLFVFNAFFGKCVIILAEIFDINFGRQVLAISRYQEYRKHII